MHHPTNRSFAIQFTTMLSAILALSIATAEDPTQFVRESISKMKVGANDWPQWGGTTHRNNCPDAKNVPTEWDVDSGKNIRWSMKLGSETYGNPVVANGKVYVGTNNGNGYLERYPSSVDLGCLICFDEKTGELLGAHMIGAEVTELIQGFAIGKTLETTEAELIATIFPHPTLSEMMHESVLDAFARALHI